MYPFYMCATLNALRTAKIQRKIRNVDPKGSDSQQHPSIAPCRRTCSTFRFPEKI